jgi:hypothetical protein
MPHVGALTSMLEGNGAYVSLGVYIEHGVFIEIFGFRYVAITKLNVERIGVFEVLDFHDLYPLSKNVLWTVSPSGNRITRKVPTLQFFDFSPPPDASIRLGEFSFRAVQGTLNPFVPMEPAADPQSRFRRNSPPRRPGSPPDRIRLQAWAKTDIRSDPRRKCPPMDLSAMSASFSAWLIRSSSACVGRLNSGMALD